MSGYLEDFLEEGAAGDRDYIQQAMGTAKARTQFIFFMEKQLNSMKAQVFVLKNTFLYS